MKLILNAVFLMACFFCIGQITSSRISGKVKASDGSELPGANITATHTPTGIVYQTSTNLDGSYNLPNLKPGGPYKIEVTFVGFENNTRSGIYTSLGKQLSLDFELLDQVYQLETIEVSAQKDETFSNDNTGINTSVSKTDVERLPSLGRSLQDLTRLSPQGSANSFGGTNYRYNNLSIDGASNNDALGFQEPASGAGGAVASGTPGALAKTQPISLDAIEAVEVSLTPFDVTQGNFTGANLNAVTRSGTNQFEGSVYAFGRNQQIIGQKVDNKRVEVPAFSDYNVGVRAGGALVQNKLFFFGNYERAKRVEPVLNSPASGSNVPLEVAQAIRDTLINRYSYDPGSFEDTEIEIVSDKLFLRLDFNINKKHQLSLRHNLINASADNLDRSGSVLTFTSQGYNHSSVTNSTVMELKSQFNASFSNHLILGYNNVEDNRTFDGDIFPHLEINHNTSNTIFLGAYREASVYGLTLGTFQLTDNATFYKKNHTITIGTQNDFYNIEYRFLTAWNGRWAYRSVQDFFDDQPSRIRGVYNFQNNDFEFNRNNPSAEYRVFLLSGYIQDEVRVSDRLTIIGGIRMDMQVTPDEVPTNPAVANTPEFSQFDQSYGEVPIFNPRVSWNLKLNDEASSQIRGGTGLFTGRIPFVWYGYSHYISGLNYGNIDLRPSDSVPLTRDLSDLRSVQPNIAEINLIDNDFKLPRVWRSAIAYDTEFKNGWRLSLEAIYTKTISDVEFRSINLKDSTANYLGADDRTYYLGSGDDKKVNDSFTNVFLLTNTDKGYNYNFTVSGTKTFNKSFQASGSYNYGVSKDVSNGVRSSLAANFNWNQAVDSSRPELSFSNFDLRHRIVISGFYEKSWNKRNRTLISGIFTADSGSPFSYIYAGDLNRDGSSRNDLIYIPSAPDEINLEPYIDESGSTISVQQQWQALDAFIEDDPYLRKNRGSYAERNGARTPWNVNLDIRIAHQFKPRAAGRSFFELTFDVFNVLSMINSSWGNQYFVPNAVNSSFQLIEFERIEDNEPVFTFKNPSGDPYQVDALKSRWRSQIGLRYNF